MGGLCNIAASVAENSLLNTGDSFQDTNNKPKLSPVSLFIFLVIYISLVLLVGKYLWNEVLCKVVTVFKPMNSAVQFLGVVLVLDLLLPSYH